MGALGCCFNYCPPTAVAAIGMVLSAAAFGLLTWGVAGMEWLNDGAKALYIISYILVILIFIGFIALLILCIVEKTPTICTLGKYLTIMLMIFIVISFILLFVAEIILMVKYNDWDDELERVGSDLPTEDWMTAAFPGWVSLIFLAILFFIAASLYNYFNVGVMIAPTTITHFQNESTVPSNAVITNPSIHPEVQPPEHLPPKPHTVSGYKPYKSRHYQTNVPHPVPTLPNMAPQVPYIPSMAAPVLPSLGQDIPVSPAFGQEMLAPGIGQEVPIIPDIGAVPQGIPLSPEIGVVGQDIPIDPNFVQDIPITHGLSQDVPISPNVFQDVPVVTNLTQDIPIATNFSQDLPLNPVQVQSGLDVNNFAYL